jgi:two-component system, NtrC family, nitrogen regulation sensor histidine kinase NtrY
VFRRKLLAVFALTVFLSVVAVAFLVSVVTRRAFAHSEDQRTAALVTQFRREFNRQGDDVAQLVAAIAASDNVTRMALALNHAAADSGPYFELAKSMAESHQLDFLEFVDSVGTIVSSAQWPAKFGYPEPTFANLSASADSGAFLRQEELQDGTGLGLFAVRRSQVGERPIYAFGGRRIDRSFLSQLDLPAGTRALLYQNWGDHFAADLLVDPSPVPSESAHPERLEPLIDAVRAQHQEMTAIVHWSSDPTDDELFHAIPLEGAGTGKNQAALGILLVGNSRRSYVELQRRIRSAALLVGSAGIVLAILLSSWAASRVTRPVEQLAQAAQEVAGGNWNARVEVSGDDELGQLADSFNRMTTELLTQRERLLQAERVAAWRELARRLAHELKNPLFPLQLTVENLVRARQQTPEQFDEVFREGSRTLLAELENLKTIIGRFSEFSKMPQPQLRQVRVNEVIEGVIRLLQAQFSVPGQREIRYEAQLDPLPETIAADAELLHRAISNLVMNAIDAMPQGGTLTIRTRNEGRQVRVEISDTGSGLTEEECQRIFTPYYTSKQHGTGLGLAIAQSVISEHKGRISMQSRAGKGTTFVIELPKDPGASQDISAQP